MSAIGDAVLQRVCKQGSLLHQTCLDTVRDVPQLIHHYWALYFQCESIYVPPSPYLINLLFCPILNIFKYF